MNAVKSIKGYELCERIGSGGFGVVHRAYQTTLRREVAIKIILPHFANHPDFIRRFESEAQVIARLEHLHIVPLYDYWRDPDGAYLVMRWLRGGNLRDALASGPFDLKTSAMLLDQVSSGLAMAHRSDVIHRDLKPANILLDEDGNAYLSDFGIAKDAARTDGAFTDPGVVLGSPDYLSPEQARSEPVTPQTDIYSLGVMLYEVLAGQHPFPHLSSVERMYKHLNEPLPPVESLPPDIADGINAIIQKATAKNPAQRYTDVLEMAADFRRETDLSRQTPESIVEQLTLREQEILQLIVDGCSNKEIAERLFLAPATVKWHIRQVYQKLRVRSRVQAIVRARDLDLIVSGTATESAPLESTFIALPEPKNPYKGLRAFQAADAPDFFGRERLVQRLIQHLGASGKPERFLAVVGPSGCGKSSVVRAGLVPALWRGVLPGAERWFVVEMIPGAHPLDELEIGLTRVAANQADNLRDHLERDARGLVRIASLILPDDGSELVVIVDQFEEVFTLVEDEGRRTQFLDLLQAAATDPRSRVRVILTLRADFYDRPLHYPRFGELVRTSMETVMPLSAEELEAAIARPAARVGVTFEPGLVATISSDVHYQPGALPLLQYALTELFEQRTDRMLTHEVYQALGGATGALARRAEDLYHEQDRDGQEILRQMFLRLVTLGEGTEDTRRRVPRAELMAVASDEDRMDEVIDTYAAFRLLTLDHDPASRRPTVEIAHEAILREWKRLRAWLNESRHDIYQQRQLADAAREWQQRHQETSYLLHGARLTQIEEWAADTGLILTKHERAFLNACVAERERQETSERKRQANEIALKQRAQRVLQLLVFVFMLATVIAVGLAAFAFDREQQAESARVSAEREAAVNRSMVLAGDAQRQFESGKSDLALALALEAVSIDQPPSEAIRTLSTVAFGIGTRAILRDQGYRIRAVAFSPDSNLGASGSCATLDENMCTEGELIIWDISAAAELRRLSGHTDWVTSLAFDPTNSRHVLSASEDGTLILWDVETGEIIRRIAGHTGAVNSVAFRADGRTAVSGSDDRIVILWDIATGQVVRQFEGHNTSVTTVGVSPDQQVVAAGGDTDDPRVLLWQVDTGEVLHVLEGPTSRILTVNFRTNEDGQTVVFAVSADNSYREWEMDTGNPIRPTAQYVGTPTGVTLTPDGRAALSCEGNWCRLMKTASWTPTGLILVPSLRLTSANAISPDGTLALIGSDVGEVILANLPASAEIRRFRAEGGFATVDVSPDGRYLLTGGFTAGTAILWDAQSGKEVRRLEGLESLVNSVRFSPDGRQAVLTSGDALSGSSAGKVMVWDIETGRVLCEWSNFDFIPRTGGFSPDGRTVLVGTLKWGGAWEDEGDEGELVLFDLATGQEIRRFAPTASVLDVSFSPDGRRVISAHSIYDHATLWDVATGQPIREFDYLPVAALFTSDSRHFLISPDGGIIYLIDSETGEPARLFAGTTATYWTLDISPDGRFLIAGGEQNTIAVWDFATGEPLMHFSDPQTVSAIWNIAFSPDGHTAFSSLLAPDAEVIQWRIAEWSLDDLLTWVRANRYVHEFTCQERVQFGIKPLCD